MGKIEIYEPDASVKTDLFISASLQSIQGKRIGLISNEWRCVKIMLRDITEKLIREEGVAGTQKYPVEASMPAPPETLDKAAENSEAIIVAMAN